MRSWMIGLLAGIAQLSLWPTLPAATVVPALALAAALLLPWLRRGRLAYCLSGCLLGLAVALWHGQALLQARLPEPCVRQMLEISGTIANLPRHSRFADGGQRQRFEMQVESILPVNCEGPRRLLLSYYGDTVLTPGQRWQFHGRLRRPWGLANPGSFNMQAWYASSGIDAIGSVSGNSLLPLPPGPQAAFWHQQLRGRISARIAQLSLPADTAAILQAITVADRSGIDSRLWTLVRNWGVTHLLVISGLHVGLVAGFGLLAGGLAARLLIAAGYRADLLPALCALAFATAYAALAGFTLPTQRALCMVCAFVAATLLRRASSGINSLLLAAVVILLLNPLALLGAGFWLSFGCVAFLLWLSRWQAGWNRAGRLLFVHLAMALLMLPLGAGIFGGASLVSAPANLLLVPLMGLFVVPLALLGAALFLLSAGVEGWLWQLAAAPLSFLLELVASSREGRWLFHNFSPTFPELLLGGIAVCWLVMPVGVAGRLLATLLLLPLLLPPRVLTGAPLVTVLDVGQGTSVLISAGERGLLYDTGGGDPVGINMAQAVVLPYIRQLGLHRLDSLVISHSDNDHSAGVSAILAALPVDRLRYGNALPGVTGGRRCRAGEAWRWPAGIRFQFLSPADEDDLVTNDSSCVLRVDLPGHRLLLAGDISAQREQQLVRYWRDALASDSLLVAHHGSISSSSPAWLKVVRPGMAWLSLGYANRFGHPHGTVLDRLHNIESDTYSTAQSGALQLRPMAPPVSRITGSRAGFQAWWM